MNQSNKQDKVAVNKGFTEDRKDGMEKKTRCFSKFKFTLAPTHLNKDLLVIVDPFYKFWIAFFTIVLEHENELNLFGFVNC